MINYDIDVGHFCGGPDDWEVYGALKVGGYVTLFQGTERECLEHIEQHRQALVERLVAADRSVRGQA